MKYIKLYEDLKRGDQVILLNATDFAIKQGYKEGDIYKIDQKIVYSSDPYFLKNDQSINNGLWFNKKSIRKATPEEIMAKKYNIL